MSVLGGGRVVLGHGVFWGGCTADGWERSTHTVGAAAFSTVRY